MTQFHRGGSGAPYTGEHVDTGSGATVGQNANGRTVLYGATYNVQAYGAKVDGSTDDTTAFDAALDAAESAGGGRVYVPEGTSIVSQLRLRTRVALVGDGWKSRIKQKASTTGALIILDTASTEQTLIADLGLDGNKANQSNANDGILIQNSGGSFETGDSIHRIRNVLILDTKGNGLKVDNTVREAVVEDVHVQRADDYGYYLECTDSVFIGCTSGSSGKTGFYGACPNSRLIGCKAFGSGRLVTTSDGFEVNQDRITLSACESQDNARHGFYLLNTQDSIFVGCDADSNGTTSGHGWKLDGADRCVIVGQSYNRSGKTTQGYGLEFVGSAAGNSIRLVMNGNTSGTYTGTTAGNTLEVNNETIDGGDLTRSGLLRSEVGTDGSTSDEHFRFGKGSSGASGNPYYVWKTSADAVPIGSLQGFDGTTAVTFLQVDYANAALILGESGAGKTVKVLSPALQPDSNRGTQVGSSTVMFGGAFFGGSVQVRRTSADEAVNWGVDGAPASGTPYFNFKQTSNTISSHQSYDGTNTRTYWSADHTDARLDLGSADSIVRFPNRSAPGTPTGGHYVWAESGALKGKGTSGTTTTIAAAEPHCETCGRDFAVEWSNPEYGHLAVCVWCLTDALNDAGVIYKRVAK